MTSPESPLQYEKPSTTLRILATTDLHAHLEAFDYAADQALTRAGLVRTASLIHEARKEVPHSVLLDNGDLLQGTALGDVFGRPAVKGDVRPDGPHPMIAAMNHLGYDAANLGNHDFEFGMGLLHDAVAAAQFPFVMTNREGGTPPPFRPYAMIRRDMNLSDGTTQPLRIAVLGLLPPEVMPAAQANPNLALRLSDSVDAARAWLPDLRAAGADVVVALAHVGVTRADKTEGEPSIAQRLSTLKGIDALVCGHSHDVFPQPHDCAKPSDDKAALDAIPIVQAGYAGAYLGVIDLTLAFDDGGWSVLDGRAEARALSSQGRDTETSPDQVLQRLAQPAHVFTRKKVSRPVGTLDIPLHSFFSLALCTAAERFVGAVMRDHASIALSKTDHAALPVLAAVSPKKTGGIAGVAHFTNVPAGPISARHILDLCPYPNTFAVLKLTGLQVAQWLERSAMVFNHIAPNITKQALLNSAMPGFQFDTLVGLTYSINLSEPPGRRVSDIQYASRVINPDDYFAVAMPDFRAFGGGGFATQDMSLLRHEPQTWISELLERYILAGKPSADMDSTAWRFGSVQNASVIFETAPDALLHLNDFASRPIRHLGDTQAGFAQIEMFL